MSFVEPPTLMIRDAELAGHLVDVVVRGGRIITVGPRRPTSRADGSGFRRIIDAGGGALLPGLNDHHLHLLAMAAAAESVDLADRDLDDTIRDAHRAASPGAWLRAIGYDDTVAGALDRDRLDALAPGRPVRVQHRSGALWILSSAALYAVALDAPAGHPGPDRPDGVERDPTGRPTGRLFRLDGWLARRLPRDHPPDLALVGRALVARGVTGVTDATPSAQPADFELLAAAVASGDLPLSVTVTGGPALASVTPPPPLVAGPVKVVVTDHELPTLDEIEGWFRAAHGARRTVAVHCVSEVALLLALAAWDAAGARPGDRIEHGSVIPPSQLDRLVHHGLTVVTQPGFIHRSGDRYLAEIDADDVRDLYRCASLLDAGVRVAGSTDAPFGPADPWLAIATAADRRSRSGRPVGPDEALAPARALDLFLAERTDPGGPPRTVTAGASADLCVLDRGLASALADPAAVDVIATVVGGAVVHAPGDLG